MSELMYASSPTWYCANAIDSDERGILYFVGNSALFLLDYSSQPPKYVLSVNICRHRAVGVSVCKHPGQWKCVTAGDSRIKLWDLSTKLCTHEHSAHKSAAVTCIDWSAADSQLIVSADSAGHVVTWSPDLGTCRVYTHESQHVTAVTCSPHNKQHVAVGYKDSTLVIIDISRGGQIVQRLRGHDEEIQSLAWCPIPGEQLWKQGSDEDTLEVNESGSLLASGSKDRTIRVWATSTARAVLTLNLPSTAGGKREKHEDRFASKLWLSVHWPRNKPTHLISSSYNGEILKWNLSHPEKQKWQVFTSSKYARAHNRIVFNAVTGGSEFNSLCTVSMDRMITLWDVDSCKAKYNVGTLGGFAYCVAQSAINPGRLAVGCGDHLIRVWNVENAYNPFDTQVYWQGLKSKVTALCWHPDKEGLVGYGTEDGRVGVYDLLNKQPKLSSTFHKGTVYSAVWGPSCVHQTEQTYALYSCGDGRVLQHSPNHLDRQALNVMDYVRKTNNIQGHVPIHSEIRWKPDYKALAVGSDDGSVAIFEYPSLRLLCTVHVHRKLINAIRWHPVYTSESKEVSKYQHCIATASCGFSVHVVDLTDIFTQDIEEPVLITQSTFELIAHNNRVTSLSWSIFKEARLVSGSYDYTAQVWDVKTGQPLANYRGHLGRVLCVQWSDLDPDLIFSGGQDNMLQCWKVSEQKHVKPQPGVNGIVFEKKKSKNRSRRKEHVEPDVTSQASTCSSLGDLSHDPVIAELQQQLQAKKLELTNKMTQNEANETSYVHPVGDASSAEQNILQQKKQLEDHPLKSFDITPQHDANSGDTARQGVNSVLEQVSDILGESLITGSEEVVIKKDGKDKKRKKHKSLFPCSSVRDNRGKALQHEDCIYLARIIYKERPSCLGEEWFHLGHFVDRKASYEIYRKEVEYHTEKNNYEQHVLLELFRGTLGYFVAKAKDNGQLDDWLLGLSSIVTTNKGYELCEAYADQLVKDKLYHKAVSYLLLANKVYEAVTVLAEAGLYKDAVCLARVRLAPRDPALTDVFLAWARTQVRDTSFETAAKCYLSCGDALEAARTLARRPDTSAVHAALQICLLAGHIEQAAVYRKRLIQDCLVHFDWLTAQRGVTCSNDDKHYRLVVCAHEMLVTQFLHIGTLPPHLVEAAQHSTETAPQASNTLPVILLQPDDPDPICAWPQVTINNQCFAQAVVQQWVQQWNISLAFDEMKSVYEKLVKCRPEKQGLLQVTQVLISVTYDVALGILQVLLGDANKAAQHWTIAIATAVNQNQVKLAECLCELLLPLGPLHAPKMFQKLYALSVAVNNDSLATGHNVAFNLNNRNSNDAKSLSNGLTNSSEEICHMDGLVAYYSYCVVKYWVEKSKYSVEISDIVASGNPVKSSPRGHMIPRSPGQDVLSPKQSPSAGSVDSNWDSHSQPATPKLNDSCESIVTALENHHQQKENLPTTNILYQLARNLLWDIQFERFKIKDSLDAIQLALAKLISKNKSETKSCSDTSITSIEQDSTISNTTDGDDQTLCTTPQRLGTPQHIILQRKASGEYIPMDGSRAKQGLFRRKPHQDLIENTLGADIAGQGELENSTESLNVSHQLSDSFVAGDEYVYADHDVCGPDEKISRSHGNTATNESNFRVSPVNELNGQVKQHERKDAPENEHGTNVHLQAFSMVYDEHKPNELTNDQVKQNSPISESNIKLDVFELEKESDISRESVAQVSGQLLLTEKVELFTTKQDHTVHTIPKLSIELENKPKQNSGSNASDSVLSTGEVCSWPMQVSQEWCYLPIEQKYRHECVTLEILSAEQTRFQRQLQILELQLANVSFPAPRDSAGLLNTIATLCPDEQFKTQLRDWIRTHSY